jgi:hypothetical protein
MMVVVTGVAIAATSDPDWNGTEGENISNSPQGDSVVQPEIAASPSGGMAVVWSDKRSGQWNVYAVLSDDNGYEWSQPEVITVTADKSEMPDTLIVRDNGQDRIFVAWRELAIDPELDIAICEAERTETGIWEVRHVPDTLPIAQASSRPYLVASAGRLHIAYNGGEENSPDILYATRFLTATTWPTATIVYTHTGARGSWYPALAVGADGGSLHMVWEEHVAEVPEKNWVIMYMRGTVNEAGMHWSPAITLSTGITQSIWPDIAADSGGNLHVVWGEVGEGGYQNEQYVRYTRYDAASDSWTLSARVDPDRVKVNVTNPTYTSPRVALLERDDEVTVCVAWHGFREGDPEAEEVLLRCSRDGGDTWSSTENVSRSSDETHEYEDSGWFVSIKPAVAFDAYDRLHFTWQERVGDSLVYDYEVYHAYALRELFLPLVMRV